MAAAGDIADGLVAGLLFVGLAGGLQQWQDAEDLRAAPPPGAESRQVTAPAATRARWAQVALRRASADLGVTIRYVDLEEELILDRGLLPQDFDRLADVLPVVLQALEQYPAEGRVHTLREVEIHDVLWDGEVDWGGYARCADRTIQIALSQFHPDHPSPGVVHHEMGHMAWCSRHFPRDRWTALTGAPSGRPPAEVAAEGSRWWRRPELVQGHLSTYGATSVFEDAAEYNRALFTTPGRLADAGLHHPDLYDKASLLIQFWSGFQDPGSQAPSDQPWNTIHR